MQTSPDADASARKRSLSPQDRHGSLSQRQRSRQACIHCRQTKRKCDGKLPCGTCVRYEYSCRYTSTKAKMTSVVRACDSNPTAAQTHGIDVPSQSTSSRDASSTSAPGVRCDTQSVLDPIKARFVRANSAVAMPRILAVEFQSDTIPRLHSFAWNLGIRSEPIVPPFDITTLLELDEMQNLAAVYFTNVNRELGLLDETMFLDQIVARFAQPNDRSDFDSVALGVAALGSFFTHAETHPHESDFVEFARNLLGQRIMAVSSSLDRVTAWILRAVYFRLTARPHTSWLASSIAMHEVEACGLHKDMQTMTLVHSTGTAPNSKLSNTRRRLFWVAKSINTLLSFEYGRSRSEIDGVTTKPFPPETGTFAHQLVYLSELLPNDRLEAEGHVDLTLVLCSVLDKVQGLQTASNFIRLTKADIALAIHRRLWLTSLSEAKDREDGMIAIGKEAVIAARNFLATKTPWWQVVHTPFQFLCLLLAMGTAKSIGEVDPVMKLLHQVTETYNTQMTRQTYNQASELIQMLKRRKQKELRGLDAVSAEPLPIALPPTEESTGSSSTQFSLPFDMPFEWDNFLNPNLVMSSNTGNPVMDVPWDSSLWF